MGRSGEDGGEPPPHLFPIEAQGWLEPDKTQSRNWAREMILPRGHPSGGRVFVACPVVFRCHRPTVSGGLPHVR